MSSTRNGRPRSPPAYDTLVVQGDKVPPASIRVFYQQNPDEAASAEEQAVLFRILDAILADRPIDHWEN